MAYNFMAGDRDQLMLMPPSVGDWLPEDHLAWFMLDVVAELDLSAFHTAYRSDGRGGAAYDPQLMLAVLIYAYAGGERSSRRIERRLVEDVAFRVVAANQQPDHATIARFRAQHQDAIAQLFGQVLAVCARAGVLRPGLVAIDGTKLTANASRDANRTAAELPSRSSPKLRRPTRPRTPVPATTAPPTAARRRTAIRRDRSEAAFAKLCGVSPIPASSEKTTRHRLNRGGHRHANAALYRAVIVRMQHHDPTKAYVARRLAEGKTKAENIAASNACSPARSGHTCDHSVNYETILLALLDSYRSVNALAETVIGLFKTELIKPRGPCGPSARSRSPPWSTSTGSTDVLDHRTGRGLQPPAHRMLGEFARGSTVAFELTPQACPSPSIRPRWEWLKRGLQRPTSVCPPAFPIGSDARSTRMADAVDIIIGVDPHKASWTAAAVDRDHHVLGILRVASSAAGYRELRVFVAQWPGARWAIEGGAGLGRSLAHRLLEEHIDDVVDVPAKQSARVRALGHGHGRKTEAADAVSTAIAARTTATLQRINPEQPTDALRLLSDRSDDLVAARTQTVKRLHAALTALIPGGAPTTTTARKAAELLGTVRPPELVAKTRRAVASDLLADLRRLDGQLKALDKQLAAGVKASASSLTDLYGLGLERVPRILNARCGRPSWGSIVMI